MSVYGQVPRSHLQAGKESGDIEAFSWSCTPSYDFMCSNTSNYMIAGLAEPRINANVPFLVCVLRAGNETSPCMMNLICLHVAAR